METKNIGQMRQFYNEKTVFLTGFTGFIGKALAEKLLRSCPEVEKIYVLIRNSRGQSVEDRLVNILKTKLFDRIRQNHDEYLLEKIIPVNGDITCDGLGLSTDASTMLTSTVSVVLHSAANIKFNAGMENLLKSNVEGTKNVLEFSKKLQNLKAFVYISTAFSNSELEEIYEKVYPIDVDPNVAIQLYKGLPALLLDSIVPSMIGKKKNHYVFTKHLAEILVQNAKSEIPVCIVRPPLVGPAYAEPFPGWIDNLNGFNGYIAGISKGIIRCIYVNSKGTVDFVPVDHVVNLSLVAAMHLGSGSGKTNDIAVYNSTNNENPYVCREFNDSMIESFQDNPSNQIFWYPSVVYVRNHVIFTIVNFFVHFLPAMLIDGILIITGKKPKMMKIYRKIRKLASATMELQRSDHWLYTDNTKRLFTLLDPLDKESFNFNIQSINCAEYVRIRNYGIRYFACNEEDKDLPKARKNFQRFRLYYITSWCILILVVLSIIGLLIWLSIPTEFYATYK